jgi:hypothetical protein
VPLFGGSEYILKVKKGEEWEEIARYNRRVSWREVKKEMGDLCEKYDAVRLDDHRGRAQWVKNCETGETKKMMQLRNVMDVFATAMSSAMTSMATIMSTQTQLLQSQIESLRKQLEERPSLFDQIAQIGETIAILESLAEWYNKIRGSSGGNIFDRIAESLVWSFLHKMGLAPTPYPSPIPIAPPAQAEAPVEGKPMSSPRVDIKEILREKLEKYKVKCLSEIMEGEKCEATKPAPG